MTAVAPPAPDEDPLVDITDVGVTRSRRALKVDLMEAQDMTFFEAEAWIQEHSEQAAEAAIRQRWGAL